MFNVQTRFSKTTFAFSNFSEIADQQNPKHYYYMDKFMFGSQGGNIQIVSHINKKHKQSQKKLKIDIIQSQNMPQYKYQACQSPQLLQLPYKSIQTSFPTLHYKTITSIPIPPFPQHKSLIIVLDLCNKNDLINQLLTSSGDEFKFQITFLNDNSHFAQNNPKIWMYFLLIIMVAGTFWFVNQVQYHKKKSQNSQFALITMLLALMLINYLIVFVALTVYSLSGKGFEFLSIQMFNLMAQLIMVFYFVALSFGFKNMPKPGQQSVKMMIGLLIFSGTIAGLISTQLLSIQKSIYQQDYIKGPTFPIKLYRFIFLVIFAISMSIKIGKNKETIKQRNFNIKLQLIGLTYLTVQYTVDSLNYILPEYLIQSINQVLKQFCYIVILGYFTKFMLDTQRTNQMEQKLNDKDNTIQMSDNINL